MSNQLLSTISQKLQQVRGQTLLDRKRQKQYNEEQHHLIEQQLQGRKNKEATQIAKAKGHIQQLAQLMEESVRNMNIQTHKESEKVNYLKEQLENRVEDAQKNHQERVEDIVQKSQEKVVNLCQEVELRSKQQKEIIQSNLNSLSKKLLSLQKDFKEEAQNRKVGVQRMKQGFYDELEHLKDVVDREQERRVSSERKIQAMIEEIESKLESEIVSQGAKRKKNNQAMLKLIEVACQKIEERQSD